MKTRIIAIITIVGALTLITGEGAFAKEIHRDKGFYLGLNLAGSFIGQDPEPGATLLIDENGGGADLRAGYSFNSVFSLELSLGGAGHKTSDADTDFGFGALRLFAHYRFMPGHAVRPYLKAGIGGYTLHLQEPDVEVTATGGGLAFGGGVDYFFNEHFSLGLDVTTNVIDYNDIDVSSGPITVSGDIDEDGSQTSVGLALGFYF